MVGDKGEVKGGIENAQLIRFEVTVYPARDFGWQVEIHQTEAANEAEVELSYRNFDEVTHRGVYFYTDFSGSINGGQLELVPGSAILKDNHHPDGVAVKDQYGNDYTVAMSGQMGDYEPGETATVTYHIRSTTDSDLSGMIYNDCYVEHNDLHNDKNLRVAPDFLYECYPYDSEKATVGFLSSGNTFIEEDNVLQYDGTKNAVAGDPPKKVCEPTKAEKTGLLSTLSSKIPLVWRLGLGILTLGLAICVIQYIRSRSGQRRSRK